MSSLQLPLSRLSIFAVDPETGKPVSRLPIYAEVVVPRILPPPHEDRYSRFILVGLLEIQPEDDTNLLFYVRDIAEQAFAETIEVASRDSLYDDEDRQKAGELFRRVFTTVLAVAGMDRITDIPLTDLKPLIAGALRQHAAEFGLEVVPEDGSTALIWANPLGILTTDHVGYASFDLTRLRPEVLQKLDEAIASARKDPDAALPVAVLVHPYGRATPFDALAQRRFTRDAVVAHIGVKESPLPPSLRNMGPRSLQNPGLTDWLLSPTSFSASPSTLVGESGCEELVPSNLALQEFIVRQVVRITDPSEELAVPAPYRAAYVDEYKVTWSALGHSLGEVLYSLPLAPGESVKLAVIDWSWDSLVRRDEQTKLTEDVIHQTHRDRTIAEVVRAGLSELQRGSSSISGSSISAGVTGGLNLGVVSIGAALSGAWSFGGATASSEGSRQLAAENVQRLSDSFAQASSAQRALQSTVVIQARQEEKESVQTRTFTNYNHSHTLTVLYYEVLRHYLVTVERVRRRAAVLVKIPPSIGQFDEATTIKHRHVIEPALLDPSLKPGFAAIEKLLTLKADRAARGLSETEDTVFPAPPYKGELEFDVFEFSVRTGNPKNKDNYNDIMLHGDGNTAHIFAILAGGHLIPLQRFEGLGTEGGATRAELEELLNFNAGGRFRNLQELSTFLAWPVRWTDEAVPRLERFAIKWADLLGFLINVGDDDWHMWSLGVSGYADQERIELLPLKEYDRHFGRHRGGGQDDFGNNTFMEGIARPPQGAAPEPILSPEKSLTPEERYQRRRLIDHIQGHLDYYNRVILMSTDSNAVAVQFESAPWGQPGTSLIDHAEPQPLDVFGSYVAYALAREKPDSPTRIVNLAAALGSNDPVRRQWAQDELNRMSDAERQAVLEEMALEAAKSERLMTLPTRGVFAEGKLGHCNVSEEIDNTRFWKWDEHPIPFEAPGINPVTPVTPSPQPVNVAPTTFPQPLVNIVNPTPAPDPTGLVAGLSLLGTPNIFRDMSGRQEVADLLKKLSDGAISTAEAANRAREIQAKHGEALDKQQKDLELGRINADSDLAKELLQQRREEAQKVSPSEAHDAIKVSESEMKKGNTTPAEHKEYTKQQLQNVKGATPKPAAVSVKRKTFVFKTKDYQGKDLGFDLKVRIFDHKDRDPQGGSKKVYEGAFVRAGSVAVEFKEADPIIDIQIDRDAFDFQVGSWYTVHIPEIRLTSGSFTKIKPSQAHINVMIRQQTIHVKYEEETIEKAAEKFSNQFGAELGIDKVAAAKFIAEHGTSSDSQQSNKRIYSLELPGKAFYLEITPES